MSSCRTHGWLSYIDSFSTMSRTDAGYKLSLYPRPPTSMPLGSVSCLRLRTPCPGYVRENMFRWIQYRLMSSLSSATTDGRAATAAASFVPVACPVGAVLSHHFDDKWSPAAAPYHDPGNKWPAIHQAASSTAPAINSPGRHSMHFDGAFATVARCLSLFVRGPAGGRRSSRISGHSRRLRGVLEKLEWLSAGMQRSLSGQSW